MTISNTIYLFAPAVHVFWMKVAGAGFVSSLLLFFWNVSTPETDGHGENQDKAKDDEAADDKVGGTRERIGQLPGGSVDPAIMMMMIVMITKIVMTITNRMLIITSSHLMFYALS